MSASRGRRPRRRGSTGWDLLIELVWLPSLVKLYAALALFVIAGPIAGLWPVALACAVLAVFAAAFWFGTRAPALCGVETKAGKACPWDVTGFWSACKWHKGRKGLWPTHRDPSGRWVWSDKRPQVAAITPQPRLDHARQGWSKEAVIGVLQLLASVAALIVAIIATAP